MKTLLKFALGVGLVWYLYDRYQRQFSVEPAKALPEGGKPTGRVASTTGGGRPGEDVVGFDPKSFMEVLLPTGEKMWVELKQKVQNAVSQKA